MRTVERDIIRPDISKATTEGMDEVWLSYCQWFVTHNANHLVYCAYYTEGVNGEIEVFVEGIERMLK